MILSCINSPSDLKRLNNTDLQDLADEIRTTLIKKASKCGGHLASNLGVVELTVALHSVFDSPKDKVIFDVSHQTYVHKMLTGRSFAFLDEERYEDVSGYTNPLESPHDQFKLGHTSTSISLACGMAKARDLLGQTHKVVAVIGDASLDGGEAFEALNYGGEYGGSVVVVINDNDMSIPENHGALRSHLAELAVSNGRAKSGNIFESLGWQYLYVDDGHDVAKLVNAFRIAYETACPIVVHCRTEKGHGYEPAAMDPERWHWAKPFDIATGKNYTTPPSENYGRIVGNYLLEKMQSDKRVLVVAASTPICIGFDRDTRCKAGNQYVDVGIAEQNAITMAAGMAHGGCRPVFATNSTFYSRAYDQIVQEVCLNSAPVTMIVTHTGVRGHTNDTHDGMHDIALLGNVSGLRYLAPTNKQEYLAMLEWSLSQTRFPVAIRVPWNGVYQADYEVDSDYMLVRYKTVKRGKSIAILALGSFYQLGEELRNALADRFGVEATIVNPLNASGLDESCLECLKAEHDTIVTMEDGVLPGGFGERVAAWYSQSNIKVISFGFDPNIPNRYEVPDLMAQNNLTVSKMLDMLVNADCLTGGSK